MNCRYVASDQPRVLPNRHGSECPALDPTPTPATEGRETGTQTPCAGCLPCPLAHCMRCGREHVDERTCPGCIAEARDDLSEITRMCANLPAEVVVKGIDSEAMNLLGPVADPEQTGHVRASINVGRLEAGWLEEADNELHPLLVLGTWMEAYCEALDHDEPTRITVAGAASYLDRNLAYIAQLEDVPFEDLARDLSGCRNHVERVLHDGEQVETGAACLHCEDVNLVTCDGGDRYDCPRCKRAYSRDQHANALRQMELAQADWLTAADLAAMYDADGSTLRTWAERKQVRTKRVDGRKRYHVDDTRAMLGLPPRSAIA